MNRTHSFHSTQRGYTLLEVSLFMGLALTLSIGYLKNQVSENQYSIAVTQAGFYKSVNDAVSKYMINYYVSLKDIPGQCSRVLLMTGATPPPMTPSTNCQFIGGAPSSPANALQPTLIELQNLSLLDRNFNNRLLFPTDLVAVNASGVKPAGTYGVRIQRWCNSIQMTDATTCGAVATQLRSLVFNTQPFVMTGGGSYLSMSRFEFMRAALTAMGSNGYASPGTNNDLNLFTLTGTATSSPISSFNASGVSGILAIQNTSDVTCLNL